MATSIRVDDIGHVYGERAALDGVSFEIAAGECFGLLGPNGGGKTTLFRIISTLLTPTRGRATIEGHDVVADRDAVRRRIGVVFQSPSLDPYLTVRENARHAGNLYGLSGRDLESRIDEALGRLDVADRGGDLVRKLSGGLKRRVEIAKSLLHRPVVLLLDEPSTGLDPGARKAMWEQLERLRAQGDRTILITTHYMDEADRCDRLAILDRGKLVALGTPTELKSKIGGDCITIACDNPEDLSRRLAERFGVRPSILDGSVRIERSQGSELVPQLMAAFGDEIRSVTVGKPTLEDVFVHMTGRRIDDAVEVVEAHA